MIELHLLYLSLVACYRHVLWYMLIDHCKFKEFKTLTVLIINIVVSENSTLEHGLKSCLFCLIQERTRVSWLIEREKKLTHLKSYVPCFINSICACWGGGIWTFKVYTLCLLQHVIYEKKVAISDDITIKFRHCCWNDVRSLQLEAHQ